MSISQNDKKTKVVFIKVLDKDYTKSYSFKIPSKIIVGRSETCDIKLNDKKISRKHTQINFTEGNFLVEDLKSTNGTYLNGKLINKAYLSLGDKLRIGRVVLELIGDKDASGEDLKALKDSASYISLKKKPHHQTTIDKLTGSIEKEDILYAISNINKNVETGILEVSSENKKSGKIYFLNGQITFANFENSYLEKAIFKMCLLEKGNYLFSPQEIDRFEIEITDKTDYLIDELKRQVLSYKNLLAKNKLPMSLKLNTKLSEPLSNLKQEVLDILQLIMNYNNPEIVLEKSDLSILDSYNIILFLLDRGFVVEG